MKDTIVFCLVADNEESYGEIANFIYKREKKESIIEKETQRVSYKYYLKNENYLPKDWVQSIVRDMDTFAKVNEPDKIKNITDKYEIVYCIYVDETTDIIDLSNLYLIKQHYTNLNIIILFPKCDDSRYFTISQFLYSINTKDTKFYNECYFVYKGNLQRAQINNIFFSREFTPLQIIDKDNIIRLFQKCKGLITVDYLHSVSSKSKKNTEKYDDLLEGSIKILCDIKKHSSKFFEEQYVKVLQKLDIFAFVLLCYVIDQEEELTLSLLERYAFQMQQYSNAVHQLAENIVFHSKTQCGVVAFRFHDKNSSYINDKYREKDTTRNFLEIIVGDFCRDNSGGNISDNFVLNLKDKRIKSAFGEMKPRAFFDHDYNAQIKNAWGEFYRNPDNIGKHFGLQIFQSVVASFGGIFGAESHCGYINQPGDTFLSYEGNEVTVCMPGTKYRIVFPIENVQNVIKKQDLSLDSGIEIGTRINDYLNYTVGKIELCSGLEIPQSQQQKNKQIMHMTDYIQSKLEEINKEIVYVSLEDIDDSIGEIIAKALTIALFRIKKDLIVVLYQCSYNLKKSIFETMRVFFCGADIEGMFYNRNVKVVLYSENFEEMVLDLSSSRNTDNINAYIAHMKCITLADKYMNSDLDGVDLNRGAEGYIPCDVLYRVEIHGKTQTLFEHYTEEIVKKSIQKREFGCQLEHTHMRLGSTIHIDKFYEAEILFGNKLFVSRFALLLVKDMKDDIRDIQKLTLYGYGTYSETVLVQMSEMINYLYPEKDIDYIILEREEERRGFLHKDRIRYNRYFKSNEDRVNYFKDRKLAIVVLINSTMKTHMRLINLFRMENAIDYTGNDEIIRNYAVLLVGNADKNKYWKLEGNNVRLFREEIMPVPQYFIQVDAEYQEPIECKQCFPPNPVAEVPLIEVNAASTIPNQAFGIVEERSAENLELTYELIQCEEKKLNYLKNEFTYGHVHRNENHFLYYFKTESICINQKEAIKQSLKEWNKKQNAEKGFQYDIVVSPMHFSNAGFVELVNNVVFGGNAILLRIDFDKEYRCNAYTKYSYLRNYVEQLSAMDFRGSVCVHYVDDAIISGRTFHRAKSLIQSILNLDDIESDSIKIKIFDKVFVLVDRNSTESRKQYVNDSKLDFYAFVKVNISSLRNYGDSCVYCNLKKEADFLYNTASTKEIADYWKGCAEKFQLYSLEEYSEYNEKIRKKKYTDYKECSEKQFRRLFCTHMAQCVLKESYHGNDKVQTMLLILKLLNVDYASREKDKYEFFLSYLKCISRPFLMFKKAVKEAIFDIMLILIETIVCHKELRRVIKEIGMEKPYLEERKLIRQFNKLDTCILKDCNLTDADRKNLLRLLMKQLTELKSNYIIRPEKMDAIFAFMEDENQEEFERYYLSLINRLVGASSDTNKSIWLDDNIVKFQFKHVSINFRVWVLLENTRAFRDGIEKLYKQIYEENIVSQKFSDVVEQRITDLGEQYNCNIACKMFENFEEKYSKDLEKYEKYKKENLNHEMMSDMQERIERFLKSLPKQKTINVIGMLDSVKQSTDNWREIFCFFKEQLEEERQSLTKNEKTIETQGKLLEYIESEADIYQFRNFHKLLEEEGYIKESKLLPEGADMLACCAKVLNLCTDKKMPILERVQLLALLLKVILGAKKVQFIVENKADSNLDEWKHDIEIRYNGIVDKVQKDNTEVILNKIFIKGKKHYSIIMEKSESEDFNTDVSDITEKLIESIEDKSSIRHNYIIDKESGVVLWKLENNQRSIWISIENEDWHSDELGYEMEIAKTVRKVMMFYQELKNEIFNAENDDFINEISHARKELSIYNSNKVYTHTKEFSRQMLFEQAKYYFENQDGKQDGKQDENKKGNKKENKYIESYPSYVLKLLADISVSQYYRYGLQVKMYHEDMGVETSVEWEKFTSLIKDKQKFSYCIGKDESVEIQLDVSSIDKRDRILCKSKKDSDMEMIMLLYALILNAAEQNRGKRQAKKNGIQDEQGCVIVKIYKDEQSYLVIENECESGVDIERVKRKLQHVPDSEDDGISLWSFNCYIRQCINSLILNKLKELDSNISECQSDKVINDIKETGDWINKLTSQEYEIQLEQNKDKKGKLNFTVKLPIFMEKYPWTQERR